MSRLVHPLRGRLAGLWAEEGFTLVELLIASIVLMIVFGTITDTIANMETVGNRVVNDSGVQAQARSAVDGLVGQLREAYTAQPSVAPIITMGSTQVSFYVPDELTPFHLLKVSYRVTGGALQRAVETSTNTNGPPWLWPTPDAPGPWGTVADSITNTDVFTYLEADGHTSAPDASHVSSVVVKVSTTGFVRGSTTTTYTTSATIRGTEVTS